MNCASAQSLLLQADSLEPASWATEVTEHVETCAACTKMATDLRQLESVWRDQLLPAECEGAKHAFFPQLATLERTMQPPRRRWAPPTRWAMAAALLLSVGLVSWMMYPTPSRANSDLVERLVDWNLALASATPEERQRMLKEQEIRFRQELEKAHLTPEDRKLAEQFLDTSVKLATQTPDPMGVTQLLGELVDEIDDRVEKAEQKGDTKEYERKAACSMKMKTWFEYQSKLYEAKRERESHEHRDKEKGEKSENRPPEKKLSEVAKGPPMMGPRLPNPFARKFLPLIKHGFPGQHHK